LDFAIGIVDQLAVPDLRPRRELGPAVLTFLVDRNVANDEPQFVDSNLTEAAQRVAVERIEPTARDGELAHHACPKHSSCAKRIAPPTRLRLSISMARVSSSRVVFGRVSHSTN